jgi:hypothetical protein
VTALSVTYGLPARRDFGESHDTRGRAYLLGGLGLAVSSPIVSFRFVLSMPHDTCCGWPDTLTLRLGGDLIDLFFLISLCFSISFIRISTSTPLYVRVKDSSSSSSPFSRHSDAKSNQYPRGFATAMNAHLVGGQSLVEMAARWRT